MSRTALHLTLLLAIGGALFFVNLGVPKLWDVDEAVFAATAQTMVQRGDLVVPYFNGDINPHKPILTFWVMILNWTLFGQSELTVRLGSAVIGLVTLLVVYDLARRLFDRETGLWAGLAMASNLSYCIIARAGTPDAPLTLCCTLALWTFVRATCGPGGDWASVLPAPRPAERFCPSWLAWAACYAAMGVAVLAKGPIGVLLPTSAIGLFLLFARRPEPADGAAAPGGLRRWASAFAPGHVLRTIWSMRPLTAWAVVLTVAGPWYVWVGLRTNWRWPAEFLGVHNFGRFLSPMEAHQGPFFYYLVAIAIFFFPWSILLAPAGVQFVRGLRTRDARQPVYLLLAAWLAVWIGFFSLASTKLPSYVVPAYPALAVATAALVRRWASQPGSLSRGWLRAAWGNVLLVGLFVVALAPASAAADSLGWVRIPRSVVQGLLGAQPVLVALGTLLAAAAIGGWVLAERRRAASAYVLGGCAPMFVGGLLAVAVLPIDRQQSSSRFAETIRENTTHERPTVAQLDYFRPSMVYYGGTDLARCDSPDDVPQFFAMHQRDAFLLLMADQYQQLAGNLPADVTVLDKQERFLKPGQVVLLGRVGNVARWPTASAEAPPTQARRDGEARK